MWTYSLTCRRLRLPALAGHKRKGVSSPVRHECTRTSSDFQTCGKTIWRGQEGRGLPAIRKWMEESNAKYSVHFVVINVAEKAANTTVRGRLGDVDHYDGDG